MNAHAKRPETEKMCISCIMHLNGYMSLIVICKRFHFLVEILIQTCNMIPCQCCQLLVMGWTQFYRTSFFKHRTQICSSIGNRTRTPYFWLRTIEHRTSNLIGLSLDLLNYSSNWLEHHFFEHRTNLNVFIYW